MAQVVEWNVAGCSEGDLAWIQPATKCGGGYDSLAQMTHEMLSMWPPSVPIVFVGYEDSEMIHTGDVLVSSTTDHVLASPMVRFSTLCCMPLCSSCMHAWAASDTDADTLKLPHHSLAFPTPNQARTPHLRIMYNARDLHASRAAAAALSSRLDPWLSVLRPPCVCWVLTA